MKTVINKTHLPVRIPLPRGKALHLGPKKTGQIRDEDASHAALKKLVDAGEIEIVEGGRREAAATGGATPPHEKTHGLAKASFTQKKGDR